MSAKFFELLEGGKNSFYCPACDCRHWIDTRWTISGPNDLLTVRPSIRVHWEEGPDRKCCHLFITNGNIEYLTDCTHDLAGKTILLEEIAGH